jgi:hypothetical protein
MAYIIVVGIENILGTSNTGVDMCLIFREETGHAKISNLRNPFIIQ